MRLLSILGGNIFNRKIDFRFPEDKREGHTKLHCTGLYKLQMHIEQINILLAISNTNKCLVNFLEIDTGTKLGSKLQQYPNFKTQLSRSNVWKTSFLKKEFICKIDDGRV